MTEGVELKVAEALQNDVGRGIVRVDSRARKMLDATTGDIVEIKGKKSTAAVVWQAHPQDEGLNSVRMDGYLRQNTGVALGDKVFLRKAELKEGKKIILAPSQPMKYSPGFDQFVKKKLVGRALTKGDTIFVGVFGTSFPLQAVVVQPQGIVLVKETTEVQLKEEPMKEMGRIADITYEDIGGLKEDVKKIREMVELPMRHPELFERLGIEPPKGVLIHGPPGCITGDALIALEDGRLVRIEELAGGLNPGIYIADLPVYPPASAKALHIYDVPETVEMTTETGKRLRMTKNHPLMTPSGWKEADKLVEGDRVKTFKWLPSPTQFVSVNFAPRTWHTSAKPEFPKIFDEELAEAVGIFVAEGNANELRISFAIHSEEKELRERIVSLMKRFGIEPKVVKVYGKNCIKIFYNSRQLKDFFLQFWSKDKKRVPSQILLSPNSVVAAFLRGLFEGDGTVLARRKSHGVEYGVALKSKSRTLLEECQVLLLRFKIGSRIYEETYANEAGEKFKTYSLRIRGKANVQAFHASIGFISTAKREKLARITKEYRRDLSYLRSEFERIVSVKRIDGWQRVYDFEVPRTHAFFSNGLLSHNTGKTLLAKAVANESVANFINIAGPELVSKFVGESEERMRQVFKEAEENAPTIIFMDEIDAIAPKREEVTGEVERRMVSQLLTLMDGLKSRGQVIVIGATNRPNSIDPALRRPGRFDREIELAIPDRTARKEILQIHTRNMPLAEDVNLDQFADVTHGYTGADISALAKESAMKSLRRILPKINLEDEFIPHQVLEELRVTREDFANAMNEIQPSALREVFLEVPNVKWSDIGGLEDAKKTLMEAIELPLKRPEVFEKMGIRPVRGILLVGLPGTGKTLIAKAVATESEANFISVKGPEFISKWVGESEKAVREIFRKARSAAPCIIFIDEIDAVASLRGADDGSRVTERVVNSLLTELDGIQNLKNVVVLAATNRPDILDPALLRPGRFDRIIELPPPDLRTRLEIFKVHTKGMPLAKDVDPEVLAKVTENYTGADIEGMCREAGMEAIRGGAEKVTMKHFEEAIKLMRPTVTGPRLEKMKKFAESPTGAMYA